MGHATGQKRVAPAGATATTPRFPRYQLSQDPGRASRTNRETQSTKGPARSRVFLTPKATDSSPLTNVAPALTHRTDMARSMAEAGAALAIVPKDGHITEIPELGYLKGRLDLNGKPYESFTVRGAGGIPQQPTTVTSEENLLGLVEDRTRFWAEDITVHEWAHAIENLGFDDETRTKWRDLFDRARAAGLWPGTFAMAADGGREFFAELSQSFFGVNNEIGGPEALYSEDQTGIPAEISGALEDIYGPSEEK